MTTIIISGLAGNKLVTQGYGATAPTPTQPTMRSPRRGQAILYRKTPKKRVMFSTEDTHHLLTLIRNRRKREEQT